MGEMSPEIPAATFTSDTMFLDESNEHQFTIYSTMLNQQSIINHNTSRVKQKQIGSGKYELEKHY